ncbi:Unknown protein sequence [Pseudomonas syringae pv. aceris]|nr:Unknown protein sequence [Pseudomonas syringae pv. aceris]
MNEAYFTVKKFVAALPHLQSSVFPQASLRRRHPFNRA